MGLAATNVEGLFVAGMNQFNSNFSTGTIISTGASIATNVFTSTYTAPTTNTPHQIGQSTGAVTPTGAGYTPRSTRHTGGAAIAIGQSNNRIIIPTVGRNLRVR